MVFVEPVQPVIPEGAISARENYHRVFEKGKPAWFPTTHDMLFFNPAILPDNIARGMVNEARQPEPGYEGGPDMVNWKPGNPTQEELASLAEEIKAAL